MKKIIVFLLLLFLVSGCSYTNLYLISRSHRTALTTDTSTGISNTFTFAAASSGTVAAIVLISPLSVQDVNIHMTLKLI
jgi:uncharacterized protein YcfL